MVEKAETGDVALATSGQAVSYKESVRADSSSIPDFSLTTTFAQNANNGAFDVFAPNQKTLLDLSMAFAGGAAEGRVSGVGIANAFERASDIEKEKDKSQEFVNHLIAESIIESYTSTIWDSIKDTINAAIEAGKDAMRKAQENLKQIFIRRDNVSTSLIKEGIDKNTTDQYVECEERLVAVDREIASRKKNIHICETQLRGVTIPFGLTLHTTAAGAALYEARKEGLILLDHRIVYNENQRYFTLRNGQQNILTELQKKDIEKQISAGRSTAPFPARFDDPSGINRLTRAQEYETPYNEALKSNLDQRQINLITQRGENLHALEKLQEQKDLLTEKEKELTEKILAQRPESKKTLEKIKADLEKIYTDKETFEREIETCKESLQAQTSVKNLLDQRDFRIALDQAYSFDSDDRRIISEKTIAQIVQKFDPSLSEKDINNVSTEISKILEKDGVRIKRDTDMEHTPPKPSKRSAWTENFRSEDDLSIKKEFGEKVAPALSLKNTLASSGSGKSPNEPDITMTGLDNV